MKPTFQVEPNPTAESLRQQVKVTFDSMGEAVVSSVLPRRVIKVTETTVAHGFDGVPCWIVVNKEGFADVKQSRPPDSHNLYLIATAEVTVRLLVF